MPKVSMRRSLKNREHGQSSIRYETLESRRLLAVITVDTTSMLADGSTDGQISLGEAIIATNTNAPFGDAPAGDATGDRIHFAPSLTGATIFLEGVSLAITDDLVVQGFETDITLDGNQQSRIFTINTSENVSLVNLNFENGEAHEGGAIFIQGGGNLRLHNVDLENNRATHLYSGGGAIFNVDSRVVTSSTNFTNNFAVGAGGAIFSAAGELFLSQSTLSGNHADLSGGGVLAVDGGYYLIETEFSSNTVAPETALTPDNTAGNPFGASVEKTVTRRGGGGVAFAGSTATSVILKTTFASNDVEGSGGAMSIAEGNQVYINTDSSFSNNLAHAQLNSGLGGGGIYSENAVLGIGKSSFISNVAPGGSGGGILSHGGILNIFNTEFFRNAAVRNGGGVASSNNYVNINAGKFRENTAGFLPHGFQDNDIPHQSPSGGALYVGGGESSLANVFSSIFQTNTAFQNGGAIYSSGRLLIAGDSFLGGNSARVADNGITHGGGGGIHNSGPILRVFSSTIQNNRASSRFASGGGIYSDAGNVEIGFSRFWGNFTRGSGAGIAILAGAASLYDTEVDENTAFSTSEFNGFGGGIYAGSSVSLSIVGGSISGNVANYSGGGLHAESGSKIRISMAAGLEPTTFNKNLVLQDSGGGIYAFESELTIRDAVFSNNSALLGGGVSLLDSTASFFNSTISHNDARHQGGGLYQVNIPSSLIGTSVFNNAAPLDPNIATIL